MFKRPHRTKPSALISSSARKKIINEALSNFFPDLSPAHKALVEQLVPAGLRMARIFTHLDRPLVLYTDVNGEPLWLKLDKGEGLLVPSLYTLSKFPTLLPMVRTHSNVLAKLTSGADLMIPGLEMSTKTALKGLRAHTLVSISDSHGQDEVPWAVGYLDKSGDEVAISETGKAVITIHAKDDFLWRAGSQALPDKFKVEIPTEASVCPDPQQGEACNDTQSLTFGTKMEPPASEVKLPCDEVDKILQVALQRCIIDRLSPELPMPASAFYSNYVLPLRPHDCPKTVGVKNSSFKSLAKWLKSMQKAGLLVVREDRKGGEVMLCSLNSTHASLDSTPNYRTVAAAEKQATKMAAEKENSLTDHHLVNAAPSIGTLMSKLFRASNRAQEELFRSCDLHPHSSHDQKSIRAALNLYINSQGRPQRLVPVDTLLAEAVGSNGPHQPTTREELLSELLNALDPWWKMQRGSEVLAEKKGPVPTITLQLKRAQGPKRTTRIAGIEIYDINPELLARQLRNLCAVSTSIHPSLMSPSLQLPKGLLKMAPPVEVHCQGDQRKIARDHLTQSLGIPKEAIVDK